MRKEWRKELNEIYLRTIMISIANKTWAKKEMFFISKFLILPGRIGRIYSALGTITPPEMKTNARRIYISLQPFDELETGNAESHKKSALGNISRNKPITRSTFR
jgi:hypothetical protein